MTSLGSKALVAIAVLAAPLAGSAAWGAGTAVTARSLTVDAPTVCSLTPDADADVDESSATTNAGTETTLSVRSRLGDNRRALVRFALSSCSIPPDAAVLSADLTVHLSSAPTLVRTHAVHRVTAAWTESGVTWNSQPTVAATPTASTVVGTTDGVTHHLDVTADVAEFVAGTAANEGWMVKDTLEGDLLGMTGTYASREHADALTHPVLAVTYR